MSRQGYEAEVRAIRAANPRPSPRSGQVPASAEAVLGQLAATGTSDQVRAQLDEWEDAADIVMVGLPPGVPWEVIQTTLRAAAPRRPSRRQDRQPDADGARLGA